MTLGLGETAPRVLFYRGIISFCSPGWLRQAFITILVLKLLSIATNALKGMSVQGSSTCSRIEGSKVALSNRNRDTSNLGFLIATVLQSKRKIETNEMSFQHVTNITFIKTSLLLLRQCLRM